MRIKTKLQINSGLSIIVMLGISVILLLTSFQVKEALKKETFANQIAKGVFDLNLVVHNYLLYHEKRAWRQWQTKHESLKIIFTQDKLPVTDLVIFNRIEEDYKQLKTVFSRLVQDYEKEKALERRPVASLELEGRLINQLLLRSQTLVSHAQQLAEKSKAEALKA